MVPATHKKGLELPAEGDTLYDSGRGYIDQFLAYKAHRRNGAGQR